MLLPTGKCHITPDLDKTNMQHTMPTAKQLAYLQFRISDSLRQCLQLVLDDDHDDDDDDCFCIALFSALEQTHCARV